MAHTFTLTLNFLNVEQLDILQAAVRLAGLNLEILYQKGILSEDYVAAYGDFFKELGNELTRAYDLCYNPDSNGYKFSTYDIDCSSLPCGGELDVEGGAADEK